MTTLYKLTDANSRTHHDTQWGENVTHAATGDAQQDLCSDGWIHAYESPLLAVLLNPIGANFFNPQLWEARGKIGKRDGPLKVGCRELTTVKRLELPVISINARIRFAILCAQQVEKEKKWNQWARDWLSGKDRTASPAAAAARAARAAAAWAARAAAAAARAARAAAWAEAAWAEAAEAAARAARAAAWAEASAPINLQSLVEQAIREEAEFEKEHK